jgi:hypothetical protein
MLKLDTNYGFYELFYSTHHLMHPHTKYNWPIWKDKKVMVRTSFAEKKRKRKQEKIRLKQYVSLHSKERHNYWEIAFFEEILIQKGGITQTKCWMELIMNRRTSLTSLARPFEEKKSSYCRHSGVRVNVSVWAG